jgi:ABC-type glycerol-3-phosphate transport system substrate-binding protein
VEAVPKVSKHQTEAWQFLKWLTDKEQETALATGQQQARPFGEPYSRKDLANQLQSDKYLQAYIGQASSLRASVFAGGTGGNEFNDAINSALANAINQSQNGDSSTAAQALKSVADAVNTALGK